MSEHFLQPEYEYQSTRAGILHCVDKIDKVVQTEPRQKEGIVSTIMF